ncbi:MAG: hypothetical protein AAF192_08705 [Pseudomonadota bacterium]
MNSTFFKQRQKQLGLTNDDIAAAIGRDRTVVSHIYSGRRSMRPQEATVFANLLKLPLDDVLAEAGLVSGGDARIASSNQLAEDATPFRWKDEKAEDVLGRVFGFYKSGVDVWRVNSDEMILGGYRKGDAIVVDARRPEIAQSGQDVIAQIYELEAGIARTVFRRIEPPYLFSLSTNPSCISPILIDNDRVSVRGVVVASWREQ